MSATPYSLNCKGQSLHMPFTLTVFYFIGQQLHMPFTIKGPSSPYVLYFIGHDYLCSNPKGQPLFFPLLPKAATAYALYSTVYPFKTPQRQNYISLILQRSTLRMPLYYQGHHTFRYCPRRACVAYLTVFTEIYFTNGFYVKIWTFRLKYKVHHTSDSISNIKLLLNAV